VQKLDILNTREKQRILEMIRKQWGASPDLEYVFMRNQKGKIYIANKSVFDIDLPRIDSIGMYFAEAKDGLRLSIEGSQLVGPHAKKNVVDLSDDEVGIWLRGEDLSRTEGQGFVIMRNGYDFFGCGKATTEKILNYYPKIRRISCETGKS